jgi:hypothetical protein
LFTVFGWTFATVEEKLARKGGILENELFKEAGNLDAHAPGFFSPDRLIWQIKAFMILQCDVPKVDAITFLESLPDSASIVRLSTGCVTETHPGHDQACCVSLYQYLWLCLAHEKVGLHIGALRMIELATVTHPPPIPHVQKVCA